ncbi:unnamed protein product, partial [Pylaiella littoralis]
MLAFLFSERCCGVALFVSLTCVCSYRKKIQPSKIIIKKFEFFAGTRSKCERCWQHPPHARHECVPDAIRLLVYADGFVRAPCLCLGRRCGVAVSRPDMRARTRKKTPVKNLIFLSFRLFGRQIKPTG